MAETARPTVGYDELATLKLLALEGGLDRTKVSCGALADDLGASNQTASRRLQRLEKGGLIERDIVGDGQWVEVTSAGERALRREYAEYRRLFEREAGTELSGTVTVGMGEGRHYITLPGYVEQFRERLGYEPFPGTLNVALDPESTRVRSELAGLESIRIDGWADDERTYGPAVCYPATASADGNRYEGAHVIAPERTHHDDDQLELIAPDKLRDELGLEDGDPLQVTIEEC